MNEQRTPHVDFALVYQSPWRLKFNESERAPGVAMAGKETVKEQRGSPVQLPVSTRFVDLRDAYRHLLWHRRGAVVLAMFFSGAVLLQGTVGFYRLFIGVDSRTDLIIFGVGLVVGFTLYASVTDIPALAAASNARSKPGVVTFQTTGLQLKVNEHTDQIDWSSLKRLCMLPRVLAIECPRASTVVSLSDISSSELRRLRRLIVAHSVSPCEDATASRWIS